MTKSTNSRILDEMHETAQDMLQAGLIDKHKMAEFDMLCGHESVPDFSSDKIKRLRKQNHSGSTVGTASVAES